MFLSFLVSPISLHSSFRHSLLHTHQCPAAFKDSQQWWRTVHRYQCLHMNAQPLMYIFLPPSRVMTLCLFLTQPLHTRRECLWACVCVRETERREQRKGGRREALLVLHLCWVKPWQGIAWGRHPRQKQACFSFVQRGSLRRGGSNSTVCLLRERKYARVRGCVV